MAVSSRAMGNLTLKLQLSRLLKCAVRKAQDSSGRVERKPIRQISLQPVAVGAGEEATRRPEPSMEKAPLKGVSERAGRNANEH
jgi:hypothetical protein